MTKETAMKILKELHGKSLFAERTALETLIPELADSNDERIRKCLIDFFEDWHENKSHCWGIAVTAILAWLEKQGSSSVKWQKNTPNYKPAINHSVLMKTTQGIAEGEWQGEDWFQYRWSWTLKDSDVLAWMELSDLNEQGEQKPFDYEHATITQKDFASVGETATIELSSPIDCGDRIYHVSHKPIEKNGEQKPILDFKANNWHVSKVDGKIHDMTYNSTDRAEPKFKVGDFIVNDYCVGRVVEITNNAYLLDTGQGIPFSCEDNMHLWTIKDANEGNILAGKIDGDSYILIFKTIKDGWIETYGHYYNAVNRFCVPSQLFCRDYQGTFTPATKAQRDILLKAMADAGFEWDAEKKELKKLTQSVTKKSDQDAWSEEDEEMTEDLIKGCISAEKAHHFVHTSKEIADWLKPLKDRIICKSII